MASIEKQSVSYSCFPGKGKHTRSFVFVCINYIRMFCFYLCMPFEELLCLYKYTSYNITSSLTPLRANCGERQLPILCELLCYFISTQHAITRQKENKCEIPNNISNTSWQQAPRFILPYSYICFCFHGKNLISL